MASTSSITAQSASVTPGNSNSIYTSTQHNTNTAHLQLHAEGDSRTSPDNHTSTSIEMSEMDAARQQPGGVTVQDGEQISGTNNTSKATTSIQHDAAATESESTVAPLPTSSTQPLTTTASTSEDKPSISRLDSVAIGEATEEPITTPSTTGPTLIITLLLTTGARHPYKIDEKYLTKRNVNVTGLTEDGKKDPLSISVYTLKELILREWREEWEVKPSSPSSIRLIFFGRLLDDSVQLKDCRFNTETANVVHMTVRPQDIVDDEEAAKGKTGAGARGDREDTAGCRCVIL